MVGILDQPEFRKHVVPLSVAAYHRLGELGLVDKRTELIRGVIIEKMSKSPLHELITDQLVDLVKAAAGDGFWVRKEAPITLADSEPEPDVSVVPGRRVDYAEAHPNSAALVIEVAVSSIDLDREKAAVYAEAGVAEYWLVLVEQKQVEVHRSLAGKGYSCRDIFGVGDVVQSSVLPSFKVAAADLFPAAPKT